jgi:hypothetical protein
MEYRGKQYSIVQGLGGSSWKWSVQLNGHTKSGKAMSRLVGIKLAQREIDRALAPKRRLVPPAAPSRACSAITGFWSAVLFRLMRS